MKGAHIAGSTCRNFRSSALNDNAENRTGRFDAKRVYSLPNAEKKLNCLKEAFSRFTSLLSRTATALQENVPEYWNIVVCSALLKLHLYENTHEKTELENDIKNAWLKIETVNYKSTVDQRAEELARAVDERNFSETCKQAKGLVSDGVNFIGSAGKKLFA